MGDPRSAAEVADLDVDVVADECQDSQCIPDGLEDEIDYCRQSAPEDAAFDRMVGALEDILADDTFEEAQTSFCKEHCHVFEEGDENKLEYTQLFEQYTDLLDSVIEARLAEAVPDLSLPVFMDQVSRRGGMEGDVFELLLTLCDFQAFKDLMLAYKQQAAGKLPQLHISVQPMRVLADEEQGGEPRPDLDTQLQISPIRRQLAALV